jgi:hypothetical protein
MQQSNPFVVSLSNHFNPFVVSLSNHFKPFDKAFSPEQSRRVRANGW